ncbi:MAG: phosphotransferase [Bacteroidales bacterium]|jgi:aminoglycoside/choline kinase family phosphotransferase|nr:phosphotransferase [Bacteroidales bacterium]
MIDDSLYIRITSLFSKYSSETISRIEPLTAAGSPRSYFRVFSAQGKTTIACKGTQLAENQTFLYFCSFFYDKGLPVPQVLATEEEPWMYLLEDCGTIDLLSAKKHFTPEQTMTAYKQVLQDLIQFQIQGSDCDFSQTFVRSEFDETAMKWDLSYFKYYYLKLSGVECNEQKLEEDFNTLIAFLSQTDHSFFMYRDFQARNIMVQDDSFRYIDFQGAMKGPLQYDVVSLLYQAKAELNTEVRHELLRYYIAEIQKHTEIDSRKFYEIFQGFVLLRILQTLGAYGFRGLIERKPHFITSIPTAVENLQQHIKVLKPIISLPYLYSIVAELPAIQKL